ncbi:MAG: DUF2799 domain-containing protein [Ottowia sp.]|uniref:DUF2799 domain-containing protein n=1 Tax=unclassified Ottowia TaxID=2645081 RepID=UPI003C304352
MRTASTCFRGGVALLALGAALLSGCATMSEEQCRGANWAALGQSDARDGDMPEFGADRVKSCAEKGVPGNLAEWRRGWEIGRREVCTPGNAVSWAQRSSDYTAGFCPPDLEPVFLSVYRPARDRYQYEKRIRDLQTQIDDRSRRLEDVIRDMGRSENQSRQKQADLAARRSSLEQEIRSLRDRMRNETMMRIGR